MSELQNIIEQAFETRADLSPSNAPDEVRNAVNDALEMLDKGKARVAEQKGVGDWVVNQWLKKAVLLSFRLNDNEPISERQVHRTGIDSAAHALTLPEVEIHMVQLPGLDGSGFHFRALNEWLRCMFHILIVSCEVSNPEECITVDKWMESIVHTVDSTCCTGQKVVILGYSIGGTLAPYLSHKMN